MASRVVLLSGSGGSPAGGRLPTYLLPAGRTIFGAPFPESKAVYDASIRAVTDGGASAPFVEAQATSSRK